jgi:hypothetical protein
MQKIVNALAVLSFLGVASIVGAGYYVFSNKDAIIKDLLPIPELPEVPSVPSVDAPSVPSLPSF